MTAEELSSVRRWAGSQGAKVVTGCVWFPVMRVPRRGNSTETCTEMPLLLRETLRTIDNIDAIYHKPACAKVFIYVILFSSHYGLAN